MKLSTLQTVPKPLPAPGRRNPELKTLNPKPKTHIYEKNNRNFKSSRSHRPL